MSVVTIRYSANRVSQYFDRRFWHVFVVVGCARFTKVLENPRLSLARLDVRLCLDSRKIAKFAKTDIGPRTAATKHRSVHATAIGLKTLDVSMDVNVRLNRC